MATGWWRGLPRIGGAVRRAWAASERATGRRTVVVRNRRCPRTAGGGEAAGHQAAGGEAADHETAELTASYWRAYDQRMATVRFKDVARRFPALVGQAVGLGWSANRRDTIGDDRD